MPVIPYVASNFPRAEPRALHGHHLLPLRWNDLIWSAVSVGKRGIDDMLAHGSHSVDEIRFRAYMVWANLWESNKYIYRSPVYDELDPSEKAAISYFFGMAVAKLFAERLFRAPWMVHLDRLVNTHAIGLVGRSRPDLIGQNARGRWIIIEGKGRSGSFDADALSKAKTQVRQVRNIDGYRPRARVAAEICFEDSLSIYLDDPEEPRPDSVALQLGSRRLREMYYKRFLPLLSERSRTQTLQGQEYGVVDFMSFGVSVGIWTGAERLASSEEPIRMESARVDDPQADLSEGGMVGCTRPTGTAWL